MILSPHRVTFSDVRCQLSAMFSPSSFLAVCLLLPSFFVAPLLPALAQSTSAVPSVPAGAATSALNGFDKLFEAVERLSTADKISSDFEKLSNSETIQQKRNVVSRNKRALSALREALQLNVQHPPVRTADDDFGNYDGFRALASVLDDESAMRLLDSNWEGAIGSKLDCIELGVLMTRGGPLRAALAGRDIEIIGRRGIDQLVARLDNEQSAAAAARLNRIETLRPPFAAAIREGKIAATALTRQAFDGGEWEKVIEETLKLDGKSFSADEKATLGNIGQAEILGGIGRTFDAASTGADAPYAPQVARVDYALDPWSTLMAGAVNSPALRVDYEAARAQNRLFAISLLLRVYRLQNGKYPESWETAPDPFAGSAALIYRRDGDSYLLYSVGPNAKDDGGKGIVIPQSGRIPAGADGDLVAPVLAL